MNKNKQITSFDAENCGAFGDVLSHKKENTKLSVGMLGLGYFEYWRMYPDLEKIVENDLKMASERFKKIFDEDFNFCYPGMVDTLDKAEIAGKTLSDARVDVLIIVAGTYLPDFITLHVVKRLGENTKVIFFSSQTDSNLNSKDNYMATMRNSALIAITQLSGSFAKMKLSYDTFVGEISDMRIYHQIKNLIKAIDAVKNLQSKTYGLIGHVFRGMYDLEFDRSKVKGFLGPEVMTIQLDHLIDCWKSISDAEANKVAKQLFERFTVKNIEFDDVMRSCKVGLAMRKLYEKFNLDGLCFLGQHYIEKITGAPARMGASLMLEYDKFMVGCEGDIGGLVMMDLMYQFTGNIPFQAEWGQFDVKHNALFLLGHGIGTPSQAKSDSDIKLTCSPEEWGFKGSGLNYEMIIKPGEVTMGHFLNFGDSYQMLISHGESIEFDALPCDEIHAVVKVKSDVQAYLNKLISAGCAHHIIVVHGDAREALRKSAELMRIKLVEIE